MDEAKPSGGADIPACVHAVRLPLLFPLFPLNVYFLDGDLPTLIDTGLTTDAAWDGLVAGLAVYGRRLRDIRRVILTHGHIDHMGLVARIAGEGDPEVLVHPADADRLRCDVEELIARIEQNAVRFKKMGIAARDVDRLFRSYISILRRFFVRYEGVKPLEDGQIIGAGDIDLSAVHTPGHTAGSICLFDPDSRILFSGDHVMEGSSTNPPAEMFPDQGVGLAPYLLSLFNVARLRPTTILPGHGVVIDNPDRYVSDIISFHETLKKKVTDTLTAQPQTPAQIARHILGDLPPTAAATAIFEVFSHLWEMAQRDEVQMEEGEGGYLFRVG